MIQGTMWKELDNFCREMENVVHGLSDFSVSGSPFKHWARESFRPEVRVHQEENAVKVEVVIPGVDPDRLSLSIEDNTLILSGDKPRWAGSEKRNDDERDEDTFKRAIALPVKVDADQTTAEYIHGVLRITLPKAEAAKARKINVTIG